MKKLLAILSSVMIAATSSSMVVSCGWMPDATLPSGSSSDGIPQQEVANPFDEEQSIQALEQTLMLKGQKPEDFLGYYKTYNEAYAEDIQAYKENRDYKPDDPDMSDEDKEDSINEAKTNMYMEKALFSMEKVLMNYSLSQTFMLWNKMDLKDPSFINMSVDQLKEIITQFLNIQIANMQWDLVYHDKDFVDNFLKNPDNNAYVERLAMVDKYIRYYSGLGKDAPEKEGILSAQELMKKAEAQLLVKGDAEDQKYLVNLSSGNYLEFPDEFNNQISPAKTTTIKMVNIPDKSEYKINPKSIKVYDPTGKLIKQTANDDPLVKAEVKDNNIVITADKSLKKSHISFEIKGDSVLKAPYNVLKLDEIITFMIE